MDRSLVLRGGGLAGRLLAVVLFCGVLLAHAGPATALVVDPYFTGHHTIDATTQIWDYEVNVGFDYMPFVSQIDIDVAHGMMGDGGLISNLTPGDWDLDYDTWAPLLTDLKIQFGGVVTYGNPVPGVFAVTWVDVPNKHDLAVRNTFQVVFVGVSSFHTNTGIAIAPGSVIFAYGAPSDPHGTVNLSADTPAAIGIFRSSRLTTLVGLGVGDSSGVLTTADLPALRNSGDPFLFSPAASGFDPPVPFRYVTELDSTVGVVERPAGGLSLSISPNPLHGRATVSYALAQGGHVRLVVYDIAGRAVATMLDGEESAGTHQRSWDGRDASGERLSAGVYLVRLAGEGFAAERRIVFVP